MILQPLAAEKLPNLPKLFSSLSVIGSLKEKGRNSAYSEVLTVKIDGHKLLLIVAITSIILGAVALRAHTLSDSPYPYILDGLLEASYGSSIAETGRLAPEIGASFNTSHTASTPAFDVFIATASLFQGESPLFLIQKLMLPFAALMLLGVYVLAKRLLDNARAAVVALMGASAYGPFVLVTQAAWKECVGISLLPFIFLSFMLRRDTKMRVVSTLLLLMIPFVHHLIAMIAIMAIATFSSANMLLARKKGCIDKVVRMDLIVSIISILSMTAYYIFMKFDRLEYMTPDNGLYLFLGLAIIVTLGVYLIGDKGFSKKGRKGVVIAMAGGLILLLAMNFLSPIGTIESNALWAVSLPMMAAISIAIFSIVGISILASTFGEIKLYYLAIISAPFVIVIYALLRSNDLLSLDMITRTVDLFDITLMTAVGALFIFIVKGKRFTVTAGALCLLCAALLLTVPFAVDSEKYAGVRNNIYSYEIDAMNWTVEMTPNVNVDTDEHFGYVDVLYNKDMGQALVKRMQGVIDFNLGSTMIASERWVTVGVKDLPYGWVKLNPATFESKLSAFNKLYLGGPPGLQIIVFNSANVP